MPIFFWSQTGVVLRPTVSDDITGNRWCHNSYDAMGMAQVQSRVGLLDAILGLFKDDYSSSNQK